MGPPKRRTPSAAAAAAAAPEENSSLDYDQLFGHNNRKNLFKQTRMSPQPDSPSQPPIA